jgi:branched-subunit amino acid transport protein
VLWFLSSLPGILLSALISAVGIGDEVGATMGTVWGFSALVGLAAIVAGVVYKHTRWYVVGAVIGSAVLLIVLAGVCIAFIAALAGSH